MRYIDTCCHDDYDKVIEFLLKHKVTITKRDKVKMSVAAKISQKLVDQMRDEVEFDEAVSIGETPLD